MSGRKVGDFCHILENVVNFELLRRGHDVYVGKTNELGEYQHVIKRDKKL